MNELKHFRIIYIIRSALNWNCQKNMSHIFYVKLYQNWILFWLTIPLKDLRRHFSFGDSKSKALFLFLIYLRKRTSNSLPCVWHKVSVYNQVWRAGFHLFQLIKYKINRLAKTILLTRFYGFNQSSEYLNCTSIYM